MDIERLLEAIDNLEIVRTRHKKNPTNYNGRLEEVAYQNLINLRKAIASPINLEVIGN